MGQAEPDGHAIKRAVTVADSIQMTRFGDPYYADGGSAKGILAKFSPNGAQFVVILKKGNLRGQYQRIFFSFIQNCGSVSLAHTTHYGLYVLIFKSACNPECSMAERQRYSSVPGRASRGNKPTLLGSMQFEAAHETHESRYQSDILRHHALAATKSYMSQKIKIRVS